MTCSPPPPPLSPKTPRPNLVDCCLQGDLALLAQPGKGGVPLGHIIAYQPDHDLQLQFLAAIRQATSDDDYVPFTVVMSRLMEDVSRIADVEEHMEGADQFIPGQDQRWGTPSNPTVIPPEPNTQGS